LTGDKFGSRTPQSITRVEAEIGVRAEERMRAVGDHR
jgi:hypothetical protein